MQRPRHYLDLLFGALEINRRILGMRTSAKFTLRAPRLPYECQAYLTSAKPTLRVLSLPYECYLSAPLGLGADATFSLVLSTYSLTLSTYSLTLRTYSLTLSDAGAPDLFQTLLLFGALQIKRRILGMNASAKSAL